MSTITETTVAKAAIDLINNENMLNKTTSVIGMLFPFVGLKKKAAEVYIKEIEKSNLPVETKVFMILNMKQTFKKIMNQKSIAEQAIKNAKQGTDFTEKSGVSEEWLDRFMDSAGFVSSEEIQCIWSKILANEFEKPGSTPPNMIRVLSEITPKLASAFRYICSMSIYIMPLNEKKEIQNVVKELFVPYNRNSDQFNDNGIGFQVLNELETLGVIRFSPIVGYISKAFSNNKLLICFEDKLDVVDEYKNGEFPIGNVILTAVGEALLSITNSIKINDDYYEMVKRYMSNNGVKFAVEHEFVVEINNEESIIKKNLN